MLISNDVNYDSYFIIDDKLTKAVTLEVILSNFYPDFRPVSLKSF